MIQVNRVEVPVDYSRSVGLNPGTPKSKEKLQSEIDEMLGQIQGWIEEGGPRDEWDCKKISIIR